MKRPPVLVTDGEQRAALAVVRSLGSRGHEVHVCSSRSRSLAGASRYATSHITVPDPLGAPAEYARAVHAVIRRKGIAVLLPMSEASLLAILPQRQFLGDVRLPFADAKTFERIADKAELLGVAPRVGIAVPAQHAFESREDADRQRSVLQFPVVLKPSRSVRDNGQGRLKLSVRHVATEAELSTQLDELGPHAYPILAQQRVTGPGVGIFLLRWKGRLLATFAHRRLREKPPSGGVSVYRESIAADPALVDRSLALLDEFDWEGVAMVEYKIDSATGTPYLMEVNGRFWGSLQLAIDAGVDFPALLVDAALGIPVKPVTGYAVGVRSRWWWGDVDHLFARMRHAPARLALPMDAPGRWATFRAVLGRPSRQDREEILRFSDPAPFFRETLDWVLRR